MEDLVISTMPIKPYNNINIGLMIAPTLCEMLGEILECKKIIIFNLLHSYEDSSSNLHKYINRINEFNISYDKIIKDIDFVEEYMNKIQELYDLGFIKIKKKPILRCECGKVEIVENGIRPNGHGDLYYNNNNKIYCNFCNKECRKYEEYNLFLEIKQEKINKIKITPSFLEKEIIDLANKFIGTDILISKTRNTNYSLVLENKKFNIDIDFLWMMFNQIEATKNQILIASNHQLYEIFISNYINNLFNIKNVSYIATPYLTNEEKIDFNSKIFGNDSDIYKKLAILYNLKWKYKTSNWNNGILHLLNKLTREELYELHDYLINIKNIEKIDINLDDLFFNKINLNKNLRKVIR